MTVDGPEGETFQLLRNFAGNILLFLDFYYF